jgi:pimeloyl-ACP methyl ester carboxylesterase
MALSKHRLWFFIIGLAMMAGCSRIQDSLLYFPAKATLVDVVSSQLHAWPAAEDFRGLMAEPAPPARGAVIVFHGNAGHVGHREFYAAVLTRLGWRVILAEYPGYGPRGGQLGERPLVEDAEQTLLRARQLYGAPLLVIGESLGAGVAAAASARQPGSIDGLLLITPWDRLESVAVHHYSGLPVGWFLRDRYDSVSNLASYDRPVVVALAERDDIVPARFGLALYESLSAPKQLRLMGGAVLSDNYTLTWMTIRH